MKEKRIYVIIAETVDTPQGAVHQVPGRMAAQGGHALSRMKMHRVMDSLFSRKEIKAIAYKPDLEKMADEKTTTIWLACRDSRELEHIHRLLTKARIRHYDFEDENDEIYGIYGDDTGCHPCTALATVPVYPEQVTDIIDYLPLWTPEGKAAQ